MKKALKQNQEEQQNLTRFKTEVEAKKQNSLLRSTTTANTALTDRSSAPNEKPKNI